MLNDLERLLRVRRAWRDVVRSVRKLGNELAACAKEAWDEVATDDNAMRP